MSNSITWNDVIGPEKSKPYFKETLAYVAEQRKMVKLSILLKTTFFNAFRYTSSSLILKVILGKTLTILASSRPLFSVLPGIASPPSLVNMYKEPEKEG